MKRTKETILAGLLNDEEKDVILKFVCSELEIPYEKFTFKNTLNLENKFNNLCAVPNLYAVNIEEASSSNLAFMIFQNITQQTKVKNVIFFNIDTQKYLVLINSTIKYFSHLNNDIIEINYNIDADLSISFDTFDDAYNFILSHIFDDTYMDAKLDLAYKIIEPNESDDEDTNWELDPNGL